LAEAAFEAQLADADTYNNEETGVDLRGVHKLAAYIQHLKWVRDTYPSSSDRALQLLERCTYELKSETSLQNDTRFVKLWIEYADMVRTPGEIFTFMGANKIGERVSLFWIAWAFVAEKAGGWKLTDQIFQK
ncbi:Mad3/BUB1 homology region 1-domain-containing protein, partial [Ochromonadaceae sp. CCMP2298]